jgi:hypothetical protein
MTGLASGEKPLGDRGMPAIFEWLALSQSVHWQVSGLEPLDLSFLRCPLFACRDSWSERESLPGHQE